MHDEEIHDLYCSPDTVHMIKSRKMKLVSHVASMGQERNTFRVLEEKPKERDHLDDLDTEMRIILKWILHETGLNGVDWRSGSDRDMCWAVVDWTDRAEDRDKCWVVADWTDPAQDENMCWVDVDWTDLAQDRDMFWAAVHQTDLGQDGDMCWVVVDWTDLAQDENMCWVVVDWTDLVQDRDMCQAVIYLVVKLWVPGADNFLPS